MKKIVGSIFILIMCICVNGCGVDDVTDQVSDAVQSDDSHVLGVKNGHPNSYPDKTYGEAFDNFFSYPTWKYFVGTKEGTDEDEDGKPDYESENVDIVEFTGYCTYKNVEVKALLQFTLDKDGTISPTFLSFNDVPQNLLTISMLMDAVFDDTSQDGTKESTEEEKENSADENNDSSEEKSNIKWYVNYSGSSKMKIEWFDGIDSDGASGWVYIYENSECIVDGAKIYNDDSGMSEWSDWGYNTLYSFVYSGEDYYLGYMEDSNGGYIDYNSGTKNIDSYIVDTEEGIDNSESNESYDNSEYVISYSDTVRLTDIDTDDLSIQEINYAKNEIYARHGRKFKSDELNSYFNSKSWYVGTIDPEDFDEGVLSQIERNNIKFLTDKEFEMSPSGYQLDR